MRMVWFEYPLYSGFLPPLAIDALCGALGEVAQIGFLYPVDTIKATFEALTYFFSAVLLCSTAAPVGHLSGQGPSHKGRRGGSMEARAQSGQYAGALRGLPAIPFVCCGHRVMLSMLLLCFKAPPGPPLCAQVFVVLVCIFSCLACLLDVILSCKTTAKVASN